MSDFMKSPVPLMMMLLYICAVVYLSYRASQKASKKALAKGGETFEDFYTGGKSMNGFVVALITIVTFYSGTTFTGRTGFFVNVGVVSLNTLFCCSMTGVIMYFLSEKIWPLSKKYRLSTLSDMLELRYQSKGIKLLTGLIIVCFNVIWLITEIRTLGIAMQVASGGILTIKMGSLIAFTIIILYVMTGGVHSVAVVDSFSSLLMLFGSIVTLIYIVVHFYDGAFFGMIEAGFEAKKEIMIINSDMQYNMPYFASGIVVSTIVMLVYPSNYMSICLAKSTREVKKSAIITSLSGPWLVIYAFLGFAILGAPGIGIQISDPQSGVLELASKSGSALVLGLVSTFILAASLGTLDSTLISLSGLLSNDVITNGYRIIEKAPCIGSDGDDVTTIKKRTESNATKEIWRTRIIVLVLGVIALIFSFTELPMLVLLANHASNGMIQLVPAVIGGLYWKKATPQGAISSIVGGVGFYLGFDAWIHANGLSLGGLYTGIPGIIFSAVVFVVVSQLTHKKYYREHQAYTYIYEDFFVKGKVETYIKNNMSEF